MSVPVSEGALRKLLSEVLENHDTRLLQKGVRKTDKFSVVNEIKSSVKYDFFKIITASLLFITALSWNDTFREFFQSIESLKKARLWVYSLVITAITLLATRLYAHFLEKDEQKKHRRRQKLKTKRTDFKEKNCTVDQASM